MTWDRDRATAPQQSVQVLVIPSWLASCPSKGLPQRQCTEKGLGGQDVPRVSHGFILYVTAGPSWVLGYSGERGK